MMHIQHIWLLPATIWLLDYERSNVPKEAGMSFHLYFKLICKAAWKSIYV